MGRLRLRFTSTTDHPYMTGRVTLAACPICLVDRRNLGLWWDITLTPRPPRGTHGCLLEMAPPTWQHHVLRNGAIVATTDEIKFTDNPREHHRVFTYQVCETTPRLLERVDVVVPYSDLRHKGHPSVRQMKFGPESPNLLPAACKGISDALSACLTSVGQRVSA